jgi:hypothetical protein
VRHVWPHAAIEYKHVCAGNKPTPAEGTSAVSNDDTPVHPRTLADATVLQIVPALREEPVARTALNVASALVQVGARALVAASLPSSRRPAANGFRSSAPRSIHSSSGQAHALWNA